MKFLRFRKLKYFIVIVILLYEAPLCNGTSEEESNGNAEQNFSLKSLNETLQKSDNKYLLQSNSSENIDRKVGEIFKNLKTVYDDNNENSINSENNSENLNEPSSTTSNSQEPLISEPSVSLISFGTLIKVIYVATSLSVLVMACIIFRSSRQGRPMTEINKKYGLVTYSQDVEMRPFPLDEEDDEDDANIFDARDYVTNASDDP